MGTTQRAAPARSAHDDMPYLHDMRREHSMSGARERLARARYLAVVRSCQHFQRLIYST